MKHTPWKMVVFGPNKEYVDIQDRDGMSACTKANAPDIVRACNAHKELVSLLKRLVAWEYNPDKYTGDLADIAIDARKLLDTIEKGTL